MEIEKRQLKKLKNILVSVTETKNIQLFNSNYLRSLKVSFLSQVLTVDEDNISDSELIIV